MLSDFKNISMVRAKWRAKLVILSSLKSTHYAGGMRTCQPCCPRIRRALEWRTWCLWWASFDPQTPTPARRNASKAFSTRTVSSLRPLPTPELAPSSTYLTTPTKAYGVNILEGDGTGFWLENLSSIPSTSSHQVRGSSTEFLPTPLSDPDPPKYDG